MPAVAKKDGQSLVAATDGAQGSLCGSKPTRYNWNTPTTQQSLQGSLNVIVEDFGAVREGDLMVTHPDGTPCTTSAIDHSPALSTFSPNVYVNNKRIGRVGDKYNSDGSFDHTITTGASTVIAN